MRSGQAETTSRVPPPRLDEASESRKAKPDWQSRWSRQSLTLLGVGALLTALVVSFAARAYLRARGRADDLVMQLHTRMSQKDWSGIYGDADSVYKAGISSSDSEALFAAIDRKLGQIEQTSHQTTNISVNNSGSYLTAQFQTQFAGDPHATETIVWHSLGGAYHLYSYNIQSLPLLTR